MHDELITALRTCVDKDKDCSVCPYFERCMNNTSGKLAAMVDAADAIEELSLVAESNERSAARWAETAGKAVEQIPRWIPVTERLPQEREWVLCQCRAKIRMVLRLQNGYWHQDSRHEFMSGFVTHWMPLPEPPKEEET